MTYTTHVTYDDTGNILMVRTEETALFEARIESGQNVIDVEGFVDPRLHKVDIATKTLVEKPHEELQAEGIEPPVFIDFSQMG